jgi:hypothetical protein
LTASYLAEQKLLTHVETQLQRQHLNIMNLVKHYNTEAVEVNNCIDCKLAPPSACKLPLVDQVTIFALDVDDPIWDDLYFDDSGLEVLLWMGDNNMQNRIWSHLEVSCCEEEVDRLVVEYCNLQEW